jgi:hypothetical protein
MHPKAKISIELLYVFCLITNSGALYHRVETYSVWVPLFYLKVLARPKSASFIDKYSKPGVTKKFSGLISLCIYPF